MVKYTNITKAIIRQKYLSIRLRLNVFSRILVTKINWSGSPCPFRPSGQLVKQRSSSEAFSSERDAYSKANENVLTYYIIDFSLKCWGGAQVQRGARLKL